MVVRDPEPGSWPLPLPAELAVRVLLLPADPDTRRALRSTCRALRLFVDASLTKCTLREPMRHELLPRAGPWSFSAFLPRLQGLRDATLDGVVNPSLAAFAIRAVPLMRQLTSLSISSACDEFCGKTASLPVGGHHLSQQLSCLQSLEVFEGPPNGDWGTPAVSQQMTDALARLPLLRVVQGWSITGHDTWLPCKELEAAAWRSLEDLSVALWKPTDCEALVMAPLPRLKRLRILMSDCGGSPCTSISAAPWGPQLRLLSLDFNQTPPPGTLSGLSLPNLEQLYIHSPWPFRPEESDDLANWSLPKLNTLRASRSVISRHNVASLASLQLTALTHLDLGPAPAFPAAVLTAVLRGASWLSQICKLGLAGPSAEDPDAGGQAEFRATLAAAPLPALRELHLHDCGCLDEHGVTALRSAPWLQTLEKLWMQEVDATDGSVGAALTKGSSDSPFAVPLAAGGLEYQEVPKETSEEEEFNDDFWLEQQLQRQQELHDEEEDDWWQHGDTDPELPEEDEFPWDYGFSE